MVAPLSLLFVVGVVVVLGSAGDARAQANVTNAYTSGGTIASGTTNVITNPTTAITGVIIDNGSLQFWQSLSLTDSYVISGTGSLVQAGTGTTTLTGSNTYSGGTRITAGTLWIGAGGSIQGNVTNAASLVFDPSGSSIILFSGNITNTSAASTISVVSGTLQVGNGSVSNTISGYNSLEIGGNGGMALTLTNGANLFNNMASLITGGAGGVGEDCTFVVGSGRGRVGGTGGVGVSF